MTAEREKKKIDECLYLLRTGDKDIADKYHKELGQVRDFVTTRIEGILEVISDSLAEEIEAESLEKKKERDKAHYKGLAAGSVGAVPEII